MNLREEEARWKDSKEYALDIRDRFWARVMEDKFLHEHRQFCGAGYGMGEDSFHWMWKLLVDEMPDPFRFLEIGVYKGQILSLIRLLADMAGKEVEVYGVTMLNNFAGIHSTPHATRDYGQDIIDLHDHFDQPYPQLLIGDSTSKAIHEGVEQLPEFDMVFIDACHEYDFVAQDLVFYPERIKSGGYLITDDSANNLKQPWGFFQGIQDVTTAVLTIIATSRSWEHVITVCHDRIWRKV